MYTFYYPFLKFIVAEMKEGYDEIKTEPNQVEMTDRRDNSTDRSDFKPSDFIDLVTPKSVLNWKCEETRLASNITNVKGAKPTLQLQTKGSNQGKKLGAKAKVDYLFRINKLDFSSFSTLWNL